MRYLMAFVFIPSILRFWFLLVSVPTTATIHSSSSIFCIPNDFIITMIIIIIHVWSHCLYHKYSIPTQQINEARKLNKCTATALHWLLVLLLLLCGQKLCMCGISMRNWKKLYWNECERRLSVIVIECIQYLIQSACRGTTSVQIHTQTHNHTTMMIIIQIATTTTTKTPNTLKTITQPKKMCFFVYYGKCHFIHTQHNVYNANGRKSFKYAWNSSLFRHTRYFILGWCSTKMILISFFHFPCCVCVCSLIRIPS